MGEPRRELPVPLAVEVVQPDGARTREYAVNLSPGGMCLHLGRRLAPGDRLELAFELPPDGPRVAARAVVVWVSAEAPETSVARFVETGVRFVDLPLRERELLLAFAQAPSDRRR